MTTLASPGVRSPQPPASPADARVITPSLGTRFSGINSALLAVGPELARHIPIVATGFKLTPVMPLIRLRTALRIFRRGPKRIWHARRNVEMVAGLFLRHVLRYPLILVWTSHALRRHTRFTRFCYHRMDAVIATTRKAASFLDCPAQVVYLGVDLKVYHPPTTAVREIAGKNLPGKRNLGLFGRIRASKGTGDLVAALIALLPRYPDWGAVIIGQATAQELAYEQGLKNQLAAAGLAERVRFVGFIPDLREIPGWYRALDLVVCASRAEGFGLPCLEGMASGCPVVATTAGAWPEIISEGEDGWLARIADPADLARALEKALATDEPTLAEMGRRACAKVTRDFAIEREAAGLLKVYRMLLASHDTSPAAARANSPDQPPI